MSTSSGLSLSTHWLERVEATTREHCPVETRGLVGDARQVVLGEHRRASDERQARARASRTFHNRLARRVDDVLRQVQFGIGEALLRRAPDETGSAQLCLVREGWGLCRVAGASCAAPRASHVACYGVDHGEHLKLAVCCAAFISAWIFGGWEWLADDLKPPKSDPHQPHISPRSEMY